MKKCKRCQALIKQDRMKDWVTLDDSDPNYSYLFCSRQSGHAWFLEMHEPENS